MPELPEVETIKRGLDATIIGQRIVDLEILLPKMFIGDPANVIGSVVENISRKGKLLVIDIRNDKNEASGDINDEFSIMIHLKMTGQLIFKSQTLEAFAGGHPIPPLNTPVPNKSTKVLFQFESGDILYFNDLRTFGYVKVVPRKLVSEELFVKSLGVEPFGGDFTATKLNELIEKRKNMNIKAFLLDQKYIAGLGNIYTDEALFFAGVFPTRLVGSLNHGERQLLYESILSVLEKGINLQGASKTSYVNLAGKLGTFMSDVAVYQRTGKPCICCGRPIEKIKHVGRGTHFCSFCQK